MLMDRHVYKKYNDFKRKQYTHIYIYIPDERVLRMRIEHQF